MDEFTRQLAKNLQALLLLQKELLERQLALERVLIDKAALAPDELGHVIDQMRAQQAAGRAVNEALGEKHPDTDEMIAELRRRLRLQ